MSRTLADADVFTAIADPTRRAILDLLVGGKEKGVGEIAACFDMTLSAVSQHLRVLRAVGLVAVRQVGRERRYRLDAAPLQAVAVWTAHYEGFWDDRLAALGAHLDDTQETETECP